MQDFTNPPFGPNPTTYNRKDDMAYAIRCLRAMEVTLKNLKTQCPSPKALCKHHSILRQHSAISFTASQQILVGSLGTFQSGFSVFHVEGFGFGVQGSELISQLLAV